ncbi:hypothetical protein EXE58_12520 [Nocardioides seonyuensis]|uniref:RNA polymerase sigma factor 70 region 4 type 2 domain-containing protein n=1 Tax=Nocardioides seonyuensis TaxID=2518371 RepID=A0A4V1BMF7_9ACTN|nr:hypothetical protein [Nocardioides seonyuensis]QBX56212.1 hypothetical protein EXE58_12520 [Nocardioides seonyuensis]
MPKSPESFDAFYASTRARLLHESFALTGDIAASRAAVRDAFTIAWHHWRKVGVLEDRESWVREFAHTRAKRRHSAKPWHQDKSLDPEIKATLDALSRLTGPQRHLLVLSALSPLSMSEIARVVGMPRPDAERELRTATAQFFRYREAMPAPDVAPRLEELNAPLVDVRWPRATIIRRAGTTRRRTHTLAGAALAAVALVASGSVVATGSADPSGLSADRATGTVRTESTDPAAAALDESVLLADHEVTRFGRKLDWTQTKTSDNLAGDGLVMPCQRERFADAEGLGALVRSWKGTEEVPRRKRVGRGDKARVEKTSSTVLRTDVTQLLEVSASPVAAEGSFEAARMWFADCLAPRVQLVSTREVRGVGDAAAQFRLRSWGKRPSVIDAAIAHSGQFLVTTVVRTSAKPLDTRTATAGLAAAVDNVCDAAGAGACSTTPRSRVTDPLAIGEPSGLLSAVDLPPVTAAVGPWVGTDPDKAHNNFAATRCDRTSFRQKGIKKALTRTFLFPESNRADQFGLTQTVGRMSPKAARKFLGQVRDRIRSCARANLGTTVTTLASRSGKHQELTVWALSIEVSDAVAVPFFMSVARDGNSVSQVGFTPDGKMTMTRPDFVAVSERALQRLSNLPGAKR